MFNSHPNLPLMKTNKITFYLATALIAISGAFATKPTSPDRKRFSVYYAITDLQGGFKWSPYVPFPYVCVAASTPYCTIATIWYAPQDNQVPPKSAMIYTSPYNSVYK